MTVGGDPKTRDEQGRHYRLPTDMLTTKPVRLAQEARRGDPGRVGARR